MKTIITILVLTANGIFPVLGQISSCGYANDFNTYFQCRSGQMTCTISGCSSIPQCPYGSSYSNGYCVTTSGTTCSDNSVYSNGGCVDTSYKVQCPAGSSYNNGVCVYNNPAPCPLGYPTCNDMTNSCQGSNCITQTCSQGQVLYQGNCAPSSVATCPLNWIQHNGLCYSSQPCTPGTNNCNTGTTVINNCLPGWQIVNRTCTYPNVTCPDNSYLVNGDCVTCAANSTFFNGTCWHCTSGMVLSANGTCDCPPGTTWLYSSCVETLTCAKNKSLVNGICMRCIDDKCCNTTSCNNCFQYCYQYSSPGLLSGCLANCLINTLPFGPESSSKRMPINITLQSSNVTAPGANVVNVNNANLTNVVNITNIVNNTNTHNVITTINNTNLNNINLGSISKSHNELNYSENSDADGQCCVIIEPRQCSQRADKKWICNERRRQLCGEQCLSSTVYGPDTADTTNIILNPSIHPGLNHNYLPVPAELNQQPIVVNMPTVPVQQPRPIQPIQLTQPIQPMSVSPAVMGGYPVGRQRCEYQEQWPFVSCDYSV